MATMNVLDAVGATVAVEKPLIPGRAAAASSRPVALSSEDFAVIDGLETLITSTNTKLDTLNSNVSGAIPAGTAIIGKVGVDQTSDGTTNAVRLLAETTKVIGTVNVAASQSIGVVPATSGGLSISRTLIPNNTTAIVVKASAGQLYKVRATNNSATIAYIKIYNATSATAGSGTPIDTIMIPASTSGAGIADAYTDMGVACSTGITYVVTTGIADNDTGAPAANAYVVTFFYK